MALASAVQYARKRVQTITWKDDADNAIDLTGSVLYGIKIDSAGVQTAITGTLTIVTAASGIFSWTYSAYDVATAGAYLVQFRAKYTSAGTSEITYRTAWRVLESFNFEFISPSLSPSASASPSGSASASA